MEPVASHHTSYQHMGLFQASTEDVFASMSGLLLQMAVPLRNGSEVDNSSVCYVKVNTFYVLIYVC